MSCNDVVMLKILDRFAPKPTKRTDKQFIPTYRLQALPCRSHGELKIVYLHTNLWNNLWKS